MRSRTYAALTVLLVFCLPTGLWADALFTYGFSPRTIGMGGAMTALADDISSSFYNPGGTIQAQKIQAGIGYLYSFSDLSPKFTDADIELPATQGVMVGINLPIPFGAWMKDRLWMGFSGFFPDNVLLSIMVPGPTDPQVPMLQNSGRSVSLITTLAVRIIDGLGVGGGAQLFDNTTGEINASVDATGQIVTTVGQELPTSFAPLGGLFLSPGEWTNKLVGFRVGLTYRQRFFTRYRIPVNTYLGGIPLSVDFEAVSLYTPDQYVLGLGYVWGDRLKVGIDGTYNVWSDFPDPNLQIKVKMKIPLLPITFQDSQSLDPNFRDTITIRAGGEWTALSKPTVDLHLRGGYFYDPTPVPGQTGITNYLDTDRHVAALGPGVVVKQIGSFKLVTPLAIDVAFQYQHLVERIFYKSADVPFDNPGYPKIGIGGSLFSVSLMIGTQFGIE